MSLRVRASELIAKLDRIAPLRLYGTAALVFGLVAGASFCLRVYSPWEETYLFGAQRLRAGMPLYGPGSQEFDYPPLIALLLVPVSRWPRAVARIGWYAVNLAALLAMIRTAWRLAGGPEFSAPRWSPRQHLSFVLGLAIAAPFMLNCLNHQQTDLVIDALVLAGCAAIAAERPMAGALRLGLATALKGPELLWALFLLRRRRIGAALGLVATAVALNVVPEILYAPAAGGWWLIEWIKSFLLIGLHKDYYPGMFESALYYNQSLFGMGGRFTLTHLARGASGFDVISNPPRLGTTTVDALVYAAIAGLTLLTLGLQNRRGDEPGASPPRVALECGAMVCLILLVAPMTSPAHFGILVLPGFCAARLGWDNGQAHYAGLTIAALALILAQSAAAGPLLRDLSAWCGAATLATLLLLTLCNLELLRRPKPEPAKLEPDRARLRRVHVPGLP
jgi:Glycosyltransferase family 87